MLPRKYFTFLGYGKTGKKKMKKSFLINHVMPYQFIYTPVVNYYYMSVNLLPHPLYKDRLNKGTAMCIKWALFNKTLFLVLNLTISRYNSTDRVPQQVFKYFFLCQSTPAMQLVPISQRSQSIMVFCLFICSDPYSHTSFLVHDTTSPHFTILLKYDFTTGFFLKTLQNFQSTYFYIHVQ